MIIFPSKVTIFISVILLLMGCKIDQNAYAPNFYIPVTELEQIIQTQEQSIASKVEGYKLGANYSETIIIGVNVIVDSSWESQNNLEISSKNISQLIKNNINENIQKTGLKINYYRPNTHKPFYSFESPLSSL